jgi:hypothetical protein
LCWWVSYPPPPAAAPKKTTPHPEVNKAPERNNAVIIVCDFELRLIIEISRLAKR